MDAMIKTNGLGKAYGPKMVVKGVDLKVPKGCVYGFLGPNGAGKSTTMKMILGLAKPTEGQIIVLGRRMNSKNRLEILNQTGSLIESPAYYGHLSGRENLEIIRTLKNCQEREIEEVLSIVRMENQQHKKVKQYSLGMKQRLGLAAALLGRPKLLLLDEPTNGLDPAGIQEMRELISSLPKQYGMTVVVSSHLLSEIDQMATDVGIIDKGELIFQDSLQALHDKSRAKIVFRTTDNPGAARILKEHGMTPELSKESVILKNIDDSSVIQTVRILTESEIGVLRIEERQMSLEDIFLKLTGKQVSL